MCPVTTRVKGYPFEVLLNAGRITGAILSDQVRSLDWRARRAAFIQRLNPEIIAQLQERIIQLVTE